MFDVWHCRQPLAASQCSYISENCKSRQGKTCAGTCDGVATLLALSVLAPRHRALGQTAAHQRSAENCKHAKEVSQRSLGFCMCLCHGMHVESATRTREGLSWREPLPLSHLQDTAVALAGTAHKVLHCAAAPACAQPGSNLQRLDLGTAGCRTEYLA